MTPGQEAVPLCPGPPRTAPATGNPQGKELLAFKRITTRIAVLAAGIVVTAAIATGAMADSGPGGGAAERDAAERAVRGQVEPVRTLVQQ